VPYSLLPATLRSPEIRETHGGTMTVWAITVKAPVTRISLEAQLQTFARSLPGRPAHRAGNVEGYELFSGSIFDEQPQMQHALLLLTVDSGGGDAVLENLVKELTDTLDKSYPLEELTVSGIQMESIERSPAAAE
jgi:hypothetical protein